jgi:Domain of unknown function (DUF5666)
MRKTQISVFVALLSGALVSGACSNGMTRLSPSAPSAAVTSVAGGGGFSAYSVADSPAGQFAPMGGGRGAHFKGEGTVANITGDCPDLRMIVRGVVVTTDTDTAYVVGGCGNLRPGTKIAADVEQQEDGTFLATEITILDQPGGTHVRGSGTIGSMRGTCPYLTLVIHGYAVMTDGDTTFDGVECEDLKQGDKVEVTGELEEGASVVIAESIKLVEGGEEE